jgi:hypothetical protein
VTVNSEDLEQVLESFSQAYAAILDTFRADSAPQIVSAVLKGEMPRNGSCINGWAYYVHGIGFTVVLPSGGQVHFDGSEQGDFFTVYDISFFLETAEGLDDVDQSEIIKWCNAMCERKALRCLGGVRYSLINSRSH